LGPSYDLWACPRPSVKLPLSRCDPPGAAPGRPGAKSDVDAVAGCIVVELLTGYPLFPGEDESDQLACIIEMFGVPDRKFLSTCKRQRYFITSRGLPRYCVQVCVSCERTLRRRSHLHTVLLGLLPG